MAKILIIDDEKEVRDAVAAIATAAGHETRTAADGRQGIIQFTGFQPDLVVTDILMPEREGIETIIDLRKLKPALPIIAISGGGRIADTSFLKMAERLGATRTLEKPFSTTDMMSAFDACLAPSA